MRYSLQAEAAAKKGTTVIDVRPENEYKRGRIPGAVNCEFYRPITGKHIRCYARQALLALVAALCVCQVPPRSLFGSLSCQEPALVGVVGPSAVVCRYAPRGAPAPVAAASLPPPTSCSAASTLCRTACIMLPQSALLQAGTLHALSTAPFSILPPICTAALSLCFRAAGWDPARIARRIGFAVFGVPGTEANPTFLEEVRC